MSLGIVGAARADDLTSKPAIMRLGVLFPTNSNDARAHVSLGLAYEFIKSRPDSHFIWGVYGDYFAPSSKQVVVDDAISEYTTNANSYGFDAGLSGRYRFHSASPVTPYVGLGLGFYNSTLKFDAGDPNPTTDFVGNQRVTDNGVAGKLMTGVELKSGFLAEAVVQIFSDNGDFTNGYKLGGLGLNLGYRL